MNIMMLIFSFNIGGIERQMIDMARVMTAKGHHISICIINRDYTESILADIPKDTVVYQLNKTPGAKNYLPYMKKLSSIISKNRIQILHCQGINCVLFAALAKRKAPSLVVLNTVHDQGNYASYSNAKIWLANRFLDQTIAISESVRNEILARRMDPQKVVTIHNAIDTGKFNLPKTKATDCQQKTMNPCGAIEIGNTARFLPAKKGQDLLVRAVEKLLPSYPGLHCTFAGGIAAGEEGEFQALQTYISGKKIESHFSFLGNIEDVPRFLHGIDIFVLPSRYEGFGIALAEAMACGVPCIASRLAGPEEILNDDRLGILFEPGNPDALANAISRMITNIRDYNPLFISENAKGRFNIDDMVNQHLQLFEKLMCSNDR